MIEVYIENQKIDINESFSTILTLSIDDIKDFGAKNSTFSKTILLPGTKNNNLILGNIFNINASNDYNPAVDNIGVNFNAAIAASVIIFADNMQVFKGIFRILEVIVDDGFIDYECAVFGELGGFITDLGTKKLEDLDMGIANILWNNTNIINSWDAITGTGVVFPLIDYGVASVNKVDFDFKTFRPALFVKQYLTNIITTSGYTWDFPLLSTALFNRLIIPNNQTDIYNNSATVAFDADANAATYNNIQFVRYTISTLGSFTSNINNDTFTYFPVTPLTTDIYCNFSGQINSATSIPSTAIFYLKKNSTVLSQQSVFIPAVPRPFSVTLSINNVTFNTGDTLKLEISSNVIQIQQYGGALTLSTTSPVQVPVSYNDPIVVNDTIPKGIFQREFFSSICKMFNLYVFEDYTTEKKLKIMPFVTYYEDATAVDWSLKIDRSKPIRIKPMSEINSRYYEFKFKQDNDYYSENYRKKNNEGFGDYIYDTQYDFVKNTETVEVIFANSPLYKLVGTDKIYPAIYKLSNSNTTEDKMESVIRIMQAKKIVGVSSWNLKNGGTTLSTLNDYGYAGHLDDPINPTNDICFGVPKEIYFDVTTYPFTNLFNSYWSSYMAEITDKDSRLLSCTMKLSNKDVYQLDFSKLIWIDGVLYRLNKIEDFNASNEDTCKVELLKIINRIY